MNKLKACQVAERYLRSSVIATGLTEIILLEQTVRVDNNGVSKLQYYLFFSMEYAYSSNLSHRFNVTVLLRKSRNRLMY